MERNPEQWKNRWWDAFAAKIENRRNNLWITATKWQVVWHNDWVRENIVMSWWNVCGCDKQWTRLNCGTMLCGYWWTWWEWIWLLERSVQCSSQEIKSRGRWFLIVTRIMKRETVNVALKVWKRLTVWDIKEPIINCGGCCWPWTHDHWSDEVVMTRDVVCTPGSMWQIESCRWLLSSHGRVAGQRLAK